MTAAVEHGNWPFQFSRINLHKGNRTVPKSDLGVKRTCPETGKKFYDLNKDPIVSPYSGLSYPLSFFEGEAISADPMPEDDDKDESLSDTDPDAKGEDNEDDAPSLDETPIDLGDVDDEDDKSVTTDSDLSAAADFEGFTDDEASLDDSNDDNLLLDEEEEDDLSSDIDISKDKDTEI